MSGRKRRSEGRTQTLHDKRTGVTLMVLQGPTAPGVQNFLDKSVPHASYKGGSHEAGGRDSEPQILIDVCFLIFVSICFAVRRVPVSAPFRNALRRHPQLHPDTFLIAGGNKCSSNITSPLAPFTKNAKLYEAFKIPSESEKTWK